MSAQLPVRQDPPRICFRLEETAVEWEVREIRNPDLSESRRFFVRPEYAEGWLLFICGNERRRLAPFPPGWRLATPELLRKWWEEALPVPSRTD